MSGKCGPTLYFQRNTLLYPSSYIYTNKTSEEGKKFVTLVYVYSYFTSCSGRPLKMFPLGILFSNQTN